MKRRKNAMLFEKIAITDVWQKLSTSRFDVSKMIFRK